MPKPLNSVPEKLKPFLFHGVEINKDPEQANGKCPFCEQERKFSVVTETGQWRCVYCNESGNIYTFLSTLYDAALNQTTDEQYDQLAELRELEVNAIKTAGLAVSPLTGEWLAPGYSLNADGTSSSKSKLTNLYRAVEQEVNGVTKYRLMSTPGCKLTLFFPITYNPQAKLIFICEGLWDGIALITSSIAAKQIEYNIPFTTLCVPGANNFNPEWFNLLKDKEVILLYDNDHPRRFPHDHEKAGEIMLSKGKTIRPGWDGMLRVAELANQTKSKPSKLSIIHWNKFMDVSSEPKILPYNDAPGHHPDLPDGFDLRDLIKSIDADQLPALLSELLEPVALSQSGSPQKNNAAPSVEPIPRTSFQDLCNDYHNALHFTQQLQDTLAVMLAVVISTEMSSEVDQLWLRVIGPPGSGKSTLAEAISVAREWVAPKSVVTGFHSGYVDYDKVTGDRIEDSSLLHSVNNKTVVMKDGDTLINSPSRDRVLSELRDLYDGTSRAHYRNKKVDEFENLKITFVLCGTDSLRLLNRTFLGERFLDCEILGTEDTRPYLNRASTNAYAALVRSQSPPEESGDASTKSTIKATTYGFIQHLKSNLPNTPAPVMSPTVLTVLEDLAQFVSYMRARKPDVENLNFRPRVELATRLTTQLTKLAFCLAIVCGKKEVDEEVLRIVRKVVHDTSLGFEQEIVAALSKNRLSLKQLHVSLGIPDTSLKRILFTMLEFGIVQRSQQANNSGQRGRDLHLWEPTTMMQHLWSVYSPPTPPTKAARRTPIKSNDAASATNKHSRNGKPASSTKTPQRKPIARRKPHARSKSKGR